MYKISFILLCLMAISCSAKIYFQERFQDDSWKDHWVVSSHKEKEGTAGTFGVSAGKYFNDEQEDKGLQTQKDASFYQISAPITEFSNEGKTLIVQYSVKHEQNIDCGGAYIKLLPDGLDQQEFNGDSTYNIMFGPDICGSTKRTHVILNYKGKNHLIKAEPRCESDELTHLYTLILNPDQTYEVRIDNKSTKSGNLLDDWDFLPSKEIRDPAVSKPSDWVDEKEIEDPSATKPEGWDDIPRQIVDPEAAKPDDWDDDLDGAWEAPSIDNPEYKGEWRAPRIPNAGYKGEWVHPLIPNPEYYSDDKIYAYKSHKYIGIEIWQVKSGTIFDNFLVTDDLKVAEEWAQRTLKQIEGEKAVYEKAQEEKRASRKAEADADVDAGPDADFDADKVPEDEIEDFEEQVLHDEL